MPTRLPPRVAATLRHARNLASDVVLPCCRFVIHTRFESFVCCPMSARSRGPWARAIFLPTISSR